MSADFNKLYYDAVSFASFSDRVEFAPHFICPNCKAAFSPKQEFSKLPDEDLDVNRQTVFECSKCGVQIRLYVAVHRDFAVANVCISVEPVLAGWWKPE